MHIALTIWGNRISPVFAVSQTLMIVEIHSSRIVNKSYESIKPGKVLNFIELITCKDIGVLICGAITYKNMEILEKENIHLIPFVTGRISDVLECYLKNKALLTHFFMPGHSFRKEEGE